MEQSLPPKPSSITQTGHENFLQYSFSKNTRRVRLHGRRTERELVYFKLKDLISQGTTSTTEIAFHIGKSPRQIQRYLKAMARFRMVRLDPRSKRIIREGIDYSFLSKDSFSRLPEISRWVDDCIARQIAPLVKLGACPCKS